MEECHILNPPGGVAMVTEKAINSDLIRMMYPKGTRMRLIEMPNDPHPVPADTKGTVNSIDDAGHIHMNWDNGSTLALIPGIDKFHKTFEGNENDEILLSKMIAQVDGLAKEFTKLSIQAKNALQSNYKTDTHEQIQVLRDNLHKQLIKI
jgi:Domain of unknown function (DUF4314)